MASPDPYCYPGTEVLRNRFGIRDQLQLREAEARVAALGVIAFTDLPVHGIADEERLKTTHRAIFEQVYEWAGVYRQQVGTMTKGRSAGYLVTYGNSRFVPGEMKRIFSELDAEDYLRGLPLDWFAGRLTYFYSEIDSTHPFREGNSRTLRQFSSDLALLAGYTLDWTPTGQTESTIKALYLARDRAFLHRQYDALEEIISGNLCPL